MPATKTRLERAPFDLRHPDAPAPERLRKDPRIPDQRLTAFWVDLAGERIGRIVMVEFDDRPGWFYQAEVLDPDHPRAKPRPIDEPQAKRADACSILVKAWRDRRRGRRKAAA